MNISINLYDTGKYQVSIDEGEDYTELGNHITREQVFERILAILNLMELKLKTKSEDKR